MRRIESPGTTTQLCVIAVCAGVRAGNGDRSRGRAARKDAPANVACEKRPNVAT